MYNYYYFIIIPIIKGEPCKKLFRKFVSNKFPFILLSALQVALGLEKVGEGILECALLIIQTSTPTNKPLQLN